MEITDHTLLARIVKPYQMRGLYHFRPVSSFSIDSRSLTPGQGFIAIKGKFHDGHDYIVEAVAKGASLIISQRSPNANQGGAAAIARLPYYLVDDTYRALGELCHFIRRSKKLFVVGITGSVGKTTTKEMLVFLLNARQAPASNQGTENNFLGLAKTILAVKDQKSMVVELGANHPGEIQSLADVCQPDLGIITYIKPVHLEGLKSLREIYQEKISLFAAHPRMKAVLNRDDPYLCRTRLARKIYWYGKSKTCDLWASVLKRQDGLTFFRLQGKHLLSLPTYREYFISNALAAILTAHLLGFSIEESAERMSRFDNYLSMRMEMQRRKGLLVVNDAYNANPYACVQALRALRTYPGRKIAVLADMLELGPKSALYHKMLAPELIKNRFDCCLTFGRDSAYLQEQLRSLGFRQAFHLSSYRAIARFIKLRSRQRGNRADACLVFLKGSRKMGLEKVLEYL